MSVIRFLPLGDAAITLELGERIAPEVNAIVLLAYEAVKRDPPPGFVEAVPTYRSLTVHYDLMVADYETVRGHFEKLLSALDLKSAKSAEGRRALIPVVYGGARGPDLDEVCSSLEMGVEEFIRLHSTAEYRVYMLGFAPGHASMGGTPARLRMPRRAVPRTRTEKGSVGIGGEQCGIYSLTGPAGFWIVGQTPIEIYRPSMSPPALLRPGDVVSFNPITTEEFDEIRKRTQGAFDPFERGVAA
jgi:KipI family sensor histidine kinase inhibitor